MNPETVKNYFDNPLVVADYAYAAENVGLWNSERIVFEKYIPKSSKIIEFGCGAGRISLGLSALGYGNITATRFRPQNGRSRRRNIRAAQRGHRDIRVRRYRYAP